MPAELTAAQRRFLRSAARRRRCEVTVGKAGIGQNVLGHVRRLLTQRELVKVRLLESATPDRRSAASSLAEGAEAALVDLIGRVAVLYRPNPRLPDGKRLQLPGR